MPSIQVKNLKNQDVRALALGEKVFQYPAKTHLVYEAVCHFRAEGRAGTHSTKNRAEVSGAGKKPWRQKKTGRARVGSIRSPLWRGGGIVHGPSPRDYGYAFPRRMRWNALRSVLSQKVKEGKLLVLEQMNMESHKTKDLVSTLHALGLEGTKTLLVDVELPRNLELAARNLERVDTARAMALSAYAVLNHEVLVLSLPAVEKLEEWLGK